MDAVTNFDIVFVWDIECITMLSINQYLKTASTFANSPDKPIFRFFELFGSILLSVGFDCWKSEYRLDNIGDIVRKSADNSIDLEAFVEVAPNLSALRLLYDSVSNGFEHVVSNELIERSGMLESTAAIYQGAWDHQNLYHEGWMQARQCLKLVNERSKYANVVVTENALIHGLVQLLTAGFSSEVPIDHVFSTAAATKRFLNEFRRDSVKNVCLYRSLRMRPLLQLLER